MVAAHDDDARHTNLSPAETARILEVVMSLEVCMECECVSECSVHFIHNRGQVVLCGPCKARMGVE